MAYMRVFRANHQRIDDMKLMIDSIWDGLDNVVDKWTRGVADNNVIDITKFDSETASETEKTVRYPRRRASIYV